MRGRGNDSPARATRLVKDGEDAFCGAGCGWLREETAAAGVGVVVRRVCRRGGASMVVVVIEGQRGRRRGDDKMRVGRATKQAARLGP